MVVVLYHVLVFVLPPISGMSHLATWLPLNGILAVKIFFAISGFALTIPYLQQPDRKILVALAAGRYVRLMIPIFIACLLVTIALRTGAIPPAQDRMQDYREFLRFDMGLLPFLQFTFYDVFFAYRHEATYIGPLWTMSVELICSYWLLAALWLLGTSRWRSAVMGMLTIFCFLGFSYNFGFFLIGSLLAQAYQHRQTFALRRRWLFLLIAGVCIIPLIDMRPWTDLFAVTMLLTAVLFSPRLQRAFSTETSQFLGRISFPLYLIHELVICTVGFHLAPYTTNTADRLAVDIAVIAGAIGLACLLMPINRWGIMASRWLGKHAAAGYGRLVMKGQG